MPGLLLFPRPHYNRNTHRIIFEERSYENSDTLHPSFHHGGMAGFQWRLRQHAYPASGQLCYACRVAFHGKSYDSYIT